MPVSTLSASDQLTFFHSDGAKVDSEEGRNLQKRFTSEIFAKLQEIQPGVTTCLS